MSNKIVPLNLGQSEYIEKRSSFIGHLKYVETEEDAKAYINEIKKKYHDARHNCWCYIVPNAERYSDDGEPQGTAGIPMMEVLKKSGITNVVCIVTRYFGGILLGSGGLLRAYTKAAKEALEAAGTREIQPIVSGKVICAYNQVDDLKNLISLCGGNFTAEYGSEVIADFEVPESEFENFSNNLKNKKMKIEISIV